MKFMKSKLPFILFVLFSVGAFPQNQRANQHIESLLDSTYARFGRADPHSSIRFAENALAESIRVGYDSGVAWSQFYLGQAYCELADFPETLKYLNAAKNHSYTVTDAYLSYEIHRVRGRMFGSMAMYSHGLREQKKGLALIPSVKKTEDEKKFLTALAYENMGAFYKSAGKSDSAYYYFKKDEELLEGMDQAFVYTSLLSLYPQLAEYFVGEGNYNEAEKYFLKFNQIADQYDYPVRAYNYLRLGDMNLYKGEIAEALRNYEQSLEHNAGTDRKAELADIYARLSRAHTLAGNTEQAHEYTMRELKLKNEILASMIQSSEMVVDSILKDREKEQQSFYRSKIFRIAVVSVLGLLLLYLFYLKAVRRNKKTIQHLKMQDEIIEVLEKSAYRDQLQLIELARSGSEDFWFEFQKSYPGFKEKILEINPKISTSELVVAAYIGLGFSTREIADFTFRAFKTVETTRYNLRKKLQIDPEINLAAYLKEQLDAF